MSYAPTIPQPGDLQSKSQGDIQNNFTVLNTVYGHDHVPLTSAVNIGKHNFVTLPPQAASPATAAGELAIFARSVASGVALYLTRDGNTAFDTQLTTSAIVAPNPQPPNPSTYQTGPDAVTSISETFLPGGMVMYFGQVNSPNVSSTREQVVNFPNGGFQNNAFIAFATPITNDSTQNASMSVKTSGLSKTAVSFYSPTANIIAFYWWALGN